MSGQGIEAPAMTTFIRRPKAKIITIGDHSVGKTSILTRFSDNTFSDNTTSTIGIDFRSSEIYLESASTHIKVTLWDTAGQERFHTLTESFYKNAHGVLLVFDVTSRSSFTNTKKWMKNITDRAKPDIIIYLVGNKTDCLEERVIFEEEALKLSKKYGMKYYETSAKNGGGIKDTVEALVMDIFNNTKGGNSPLGGDGTPVRVSQVEKKKKKKCC